MLDTLVAAVAGKGGGSGAVIEAVAQTLTGAADDPAFVAEAVLLPSEAFIGDQMVTVDPDAIRRERLALQASIGAALERSEEHTSELQSLMRSSYAVFCLTKKNRTHKKGRTHIHTPVNHT